MVGPAITSVCTDTRAHVVARRPRPLQASVRNMRHACTDTRAGTASSSLAALARCRPRGPRRPSRQTRDARILLPRGLLRPPTPTYSNLVPRGGGRRVSCAALMLRASLPHALHFITVQLRACSLADGKDACLRRARALKRPVRAPPSVPCKRGPPGQTPGHWQSHCSGASPVSILPLSERRVQHGVRFIQS